MDWMGLIINLIALFAGLFAYIGITKTPWGKAHEDMQYFMMLLAVIAAVLIGGALRWLLL